MAENKIIIVIPAYEPDSKMLGVIDDIKADTRHSIVVVNDGSGEDKKEIFSKAAESAVVLEHEQNRGKGAAIKTALKYISENFESPYGVIVVDADGQHKVSDAARIADALAENPDKLIMGCRRFTGDIPARSKFGNSVTRAVFKFAAGVGLSDTQTGLRGFSSKLVPFMLEVKGDRYEYEMNMLLECAREGIEFFEVPIETVYIDNNQSSHFHPIKDSVRIYRDILKFSCSSLLSFLVDYTLYSLLFTFTHSLDISNITARVFSSCFNFYMNKRFVFKNKDNLAKTAVKYFALAACILAVNTLLLKLCTQTLIKNEYIAKILIEMLLFMISWAVQKSFVFKKKFKADDKQ